MEVLEKPDIARYYQTASLRELTRHEDAEFLLSERLRFEIETTDWSDDQKQQTYQALADAKRIHTGDTQGDMPTINHPLRVALRILSRDHFNIRDHYELIIGALLHDTVEDHPERWTRDPDDAGNYEDFDFKAHSYEELLAIREDAYTAIQNRYGERVSAITRWVTSNLYPQETLSVQDPHEKQLLKWDQYETRIRELMTTEDAYGAKIIKLSDFIENFIGGMKYHDELAKRPKMARKYIFLASDMIAFIYQSTYLPDLVKSKLIAKIEKARDAAIDMIESHIEEHPELAQLYDISYQHAQHRAVGRTALTPTGHSSMPIQQWTHLSIPVAIPA